MMGGTRGGFQDWQRSPPAVTAALPVRSIRTPGGQRHIPPPTRDRGIGGIVQAPAGAPPDAVLTPDSPPTHARLDMLHQLFQRGVAKGMHGGPEMLQYALEVVSSDTNISIGAMEQAFSSVLDQRRAQEEPESAGGIAAPRLNGLESSAVSADEGEEVERLSNQALVERRAGWQRVGPRYLGFSSHASI